MNYLAHIHLSGNNKKLMIGNFIADAVKGNKLENYETEIQNGIKLHRAIDHFTDTHEIVKESKKKLWERYRHYNAVIIDIYYDHFLAKNWLNYHKTELHLFVDDSYNTLQENYEILPEGIQFMLTHMVKNNWLLNYQYIKGIDKVMQGMSRRASFDSGMEHSTDELIEHYDQFAYEFESFYPLLEKFVASKIASFK